MKKTRKHWNACPTCKLLIYTSGGLGNHNCPEKINARLSAELDMVVSEEMSTFDEEATKFWKSPEVRFMAYLARKGEI